MRWERGRNFGEEPDRGVRRVRWRLEPGGGVGVCVDLRVSCEVGCRRKARGGVSEFREGTAVARARVWRWRHMVALGCHQRKRREERRERVSEAATRVNVG